MKIPAPIVLVAAALGCSSPMTLSELAELNADLGECALAVVPPGLRARRIPYALRETGARGYT